MAYRRPTSQPALKGRFRELYATILYDAFDRSRFLNGLACIASASFARLYT
jgi:hypothetical protein